MNLRHRSMQSQAIVVGATCPNIERSLFKVLARLCPDCEVVPLWDYSDWGFLTDKNLTWAFVEAALLDDAKASVLSHAETLVIFNVSAPTRNKALERFEKPHHAGAKPFVVIWEDHWLTADVLLEKFEHELTEAEVIQPGYHVQRAPSVLRHDLAPSYDAERLIDPRLTKS